MNNKTYYIQDSRQFIGNCALFWKAGGGYTPNIDEAEEFTFDEAMKHHQNRDTDIGWEKEYIQSKNHSVIYAHDLINNTEQYIEP